MNYREFFISRDSKNKMSIRILWHFFNSRARQVKTELSYGPDWLFNLLVGQKTIMKYSFQAYSKNLASRKNMKT